VDIEKKFKNFTALYTSVLSRQQKREEVSTEINKVFDMVGNSKARLDLFVSSVKSFIRSWIEAEERKIITEQSGSVQLIEPLIAPALKGECFQRFRVFR